MEEVPTTNSDVQVRIAERTAMILCTDGVWHMVNEGGENAMCSDAVEHVDRIPEDAVVGENVCLVCSGLWAVKDDTVNALRDRHIANGVLDAHRGALAR